MDNGTEKRYLELIRGFTTEEKERLPLEYNLYSEDFSALVSKFVESGPRLDVPELATLDSLCRELNTTMGQQLHLSKPWKAPFVLLPRDRRKIRAERKIVLQVVSRRSASIHRRIIDEYFFLTNFVDLVTLVQTAVAAELGGVLSEPHLSIYGGASAELVKLFQKADRDYEKVQLQIGQSEG